MKIKDNVKIVGHWRTKFNGRIGVIQSMYGTEMCCVRFGNQIDFFPCYNVELV